MIICNEDEDLEDVIARNIPAGKRYRIKRIPYMEEEVDYV